MIIRAKDISRIAPRPDITIIRNAADCYVKIWNVPHERTSSFFTVITITLLMRQKSL